MAHPVDVIGFAPVLLVRVAIDDASIRSGQLVLDTLERPHPIPVLSDLVCLQHAQPHQ
jgi:hypothetical protein